jgi:hypothetical protein
MTDVSALTDLPTPIGTDYLLSWRGSAPYRIALSNIVFKDGTFGIPKLSSYGGGIVGDADANYFSGGAAYYTGNWRATTAGQGGWAVRNSAGVFTVLTGSNGGAVGSVITDMAERLRIDNAGKVDVTGKLNVTSDVDVTGKLNVTSDVDVTGKLNVTSDVSFDGSVGVGTTTPNQKFQVAQGCISSINTGRSGYFLHNKGSTTEWFAGQESSNSHSFKIQSLIAGVYSDKLVVSPTGTIIFGNTVQNIAVSTTSMFIRGTLIAFQNASATSSHLIVEASGTTPGSDNTKNNGSSFLRWNTVFATSGTINTSDEREKLWRGPLNEAEILAAKRIGAEIGVYQWLDAIVKKGTDSARLHVGVLAQKVFSIMESYGVDWRRYAWACHDKWDERQYQAAVWEEGQLVSAEVPYMAAGDRYGVRPDQLALFLIAAQEQRLAALEARIFDDGR